MGESPIKCLKIRSSFLSLTNKDEQRSFTEIMPLVAVFLEKIQIVSKNGNIYYVADVKENKAPVYFKFTSLTPDGFVCENPEHDFPKRIEYRLTGSTLTVIISAGAKSQNYLFTRL